jgi:hypothetical protein
MTMDVDFRVQLPPKQLEEFNEINDMIIIKIKQQGVTPEST